MEESMTEDEMRETSPEVWVPTDEDYDPDRVIRDADWHAKVTRGAWLAREAFRHLHDSENEHWEARSYTMDGHRISGIGSNLPDALANLADAVENIPTSKR
jgi:hypothetical protein